VSPDRREALVARIEAARLEEMEAEEREDAKIPDAKLTMVTPKDIAKAFDTATELKSSKAKAPAKAKAKPKAKAIGAAEVKKAAKASGDAKVGLTTLTSAELRRALEEMIALAETLIVPPNPVVTQILNLIRVFLAGEATPRAVLQRLAGLVAELAPKPKHAKPAKKAKRGGK
jgi:hypothetical protein